MYKPESDQRQMDRVNGELILFRKGVDTMLTIDMVTLATKCLVTHLLIFTGDSNLKSTIEAAKNGGVIATRFTFRGNVNDDIYKPVPK